jgi:hypothetical protein
LEMVDLVDGGFLQMLLHKSIFLVEKLSLCKICNKLHSFLF